MRLLGRTGMTYSALVDPMPRVGPVKTHALLRPSALVPRYVRITGRALTLCTHFACCCGAPRWRCGTAS